jgi:hypothetical protein
MKCAHINKNKKLDEKFQYMDELCWARIYLFTQWTKKFPLVVSPLLWIKLGDEWTYFCG